MPEFLPTSEEENNMISASRNMCSSQEGRHTRTTTPNMRMAIAEACRVNGVDMVERD